MTVRFLARDHLDRAVWWAIVMARIIRSNSAPAAAFRVTTSASVFIQGIVLWSIELWSIPLAMVVGAPRDLSQFVMVWISACLWRPILRELRRCAERPVCADQLAAATS
jgi:hypothetical protein